MNKCNHDCDNKTALGYCMTTVCINPKFSNIGTVWYGQGVKKRVITNADRIRGMSDEKFAEWINYIYDAYYAPDCGWLEWLQQEVNDE